MRSAMLVGDDVSIIVRAFIPTSGRIALTRRTHRPNNIPVIHASKPCSFSDSKDRSNLKAADMVLGKPFA